MRIVGIGNAVKIVVLLWQCTFTNWVHLAVMQAGNLPGYGSLSSTPTITHAKSHSHHHHHHDHQHHRHPQNPQGSEQFFADLEQQQQHAQQGEEEEQQIVFHEHKYSTPLRSSGFQYLQSEGEEEEVRHLLPACLPV